MRSFKDLREKTLTAAEKKKREEIAKAMERDNPGMDMKKKMAIATWQAKKVAEEKIDEGSTELKTAFRKGQIDRKRTLAGKPQAGIKGDSKEVDAYSKGQAAVGKKDSLAEPRGKNWQGRPMKKTIAKTSMKKEEAQIDEGIENMSHARLKWHMNTGVPHGSYTKDEMKKERDRRLSKVDTHAAYKKAKPSMNEGANIDEISLSHLSNKIANSTGTKNVKTAMKPGEVKKGLDDLKKRLSTLGQEPKLAKEAKEDDEPASPDESSMALKQLEFIEYAAEEMMDHIKSGKAFPEWFQNKLSKAHGEIEGLHSAMGEHGGDEDEEEDMKESTQLDEISKKTLGSYVKKASADVANRSADNARDYATGNRPVGANKKAMKNMKRTKYLNKAVDKMTQEGVQSADKKPEKFIRPDGKVGIRMVRTDKKVVDKDA